MENQRKKRKPQTTALLTESGRKLMEGLAELHGVKYSAVIEMAIRRMAKQDGVTVKQKED